IVLGSIAATVAVLADALAWGPHHCKAAFPMVIGCALGSYESLAAGGVLDRVEQVAQRAAQAVNRPCHDDIELPPAGVLEHGVKARPSVSSLGARDARIAIDLDHIPSAAPSDLPKLADLVFDRLCVRADSHVQRRALV